MTIQDLLDQGICIEGNLRVCSYCFETNSTTLHYKGNNAWEIPQEFRNYDIKYIYPGVEVIPHHKRPGNVEIIVLNIEIDLDNEDL